MSTAAKASTDHRDALSQAAEGDILHFLSRTLQAHSLDGEPQGALEKLQTLMIALQQQESTLANWPDSPSKTRMCAALAKARSTVSKIVEDLARKHADSRRFDIRAVKAM